MVLFEHPFQTGIVAQLVDEQRNDQRKLSVNIIDRIISYYSFNLEKKYKIV